MKALKKVKENESEEINPVYIGTAIAVIAVSVGIWVYKKYSEYRREEEQQERLIKEEEEKKRKGKGESDRRLNFQN